MGRGTLVLVVGPSGVGKDSIIAGAAKRFRRDPRISRRLITRPDEGGGEAHVALSPAEFAARRDAGGLMLHWSAHGLDYGLPQAAASELTGGRAVVANVSRTVVEEARGRFAPVLAVTITAAPETLAARLAGRGREDAADIEQRLRRAVSVDQADIVIDNDGALDVAVDRFVEVLRRVLDQSASR